MAVVNQRISQTQRYCLLLLQRDGPHLDSGFLFPGLVLSKHSFGVETEYLNTFSNVS